MKYIVALLLALVAITGFAAAMTAPTTSNATAFLNTPLKEGIPTTINTPTTLGFDNFLNMPLNVGVPTGSFVTGISGNWEAFGPSSGTPGNWAELIADNVGHTVENGYTAAEEAQANDNLQGFEGYS